MAEYSNIRIGIAGASGTGKSSLALELQSRLAIPFVASRDITNNILSRDGYVYGSGVQIERFLASGNRPMEVFHLLKKKVAKSPAFVSDRTFVDLAAYAICELQDDDPTLLRKIYNQCRKEVRVYTHLVFLPWKDVPVRDNHRRTLNPWYQFLIHSVSLGIMKEWGVTPIIIESEDMEERVKQIVEKLI